MVPEPETQHMLNNMFAVFVLLSALPPALGGVLIGFVYRLSGRDFAISVITMPIAYMLAMGAAFFTCLGKPDGYEPSIVSYYVAQAIIGWPFAILVLRHKRNILWNGLLASMIAVITTLGAHQVIEHVFPA